MILLLGSSGYVGQSFVKYLTNNKIDFDIFTVRYESFKTDVFARALQEYSDLRNTNGLSKIADVINCGGYVGVPNVDKCEHEKMKCYEANVLLPTLLAQTCQTAGVNFHQISSGCLYSMEDCKNPEKFNSPCYGLTELSPPNFGIEGNSSWYSKTKDMCERHLLTIDSCKNIFRIRIPFSATPHKKNILTKITEYEKLVNVYNSYTNIDTLPEICYKIIQDVHAHNKLWNVVCPGYMSTAEIVTLMNLQRRAMNCAELQKTFFSSYEEFEKTIQTPRSNCILNTDKLEYAGIIQPNVYDSMRLAIRSMYSN